MFTKVLVLALFVVFALASVQASVIGIGVPGVVGVGVPVGVGVGIPAVGLGHTGVLVG